MFGRKSQTSKNTEQAKRDEREAAESARNAKLNVDSKLSPEDRFYAKYGRYPTDGEYLD